MSETTLANPDFTSFSWKFKDSSDVETQSDATATQSRVWYESGSLASISRIEFEMYVTSSSLKLCVDSVIATDYHWLNFYRYKTRNYW
jgi:hypothetical protein